MDWTDASTKSVKRMGNINPPDIEDETGITDQAVYESVVQSLISNSKVGA
jgi:predicted transcriptional regulator